MDSLVIGGKFLKFKKYTNSTNHNLEICKKKIIFKKLVLLFVCVFDNQA
jgi:hypothetical protein